MRVERLPNNELFTGEDFLHKLEGQWGGKLYVSIAEEYKHTPLPLQTYGQSILKTMTPFNNDVAFPQLTGNIINDFKAYVITDAEHPEKAENRMHMLADIYCRSMLTERLDFFIRHALTPQPEPKTFVIKDTLPFGLEFGKVLFQTPRIYETIDEYIAITKKKAPSFANMLQLDFDEMNTFITDFQTSLDALKDNIERIMQGHGSSLPPFVHIISTAIALEHHRLLTGYRKL